jgi:serine/threonine protein phosphatase PrpC
MKCRLCGKEIRDHVLYCRYCGAPQVIGKWSFAVQSVTGNVRRHNEDNYCFFGAVLPAEHQSDEAPREKVLDEDAVAMTAIFDGMGGEHLGEVASWSAAEKLSSFPVPERWTKQEIRNRIFSMNEAVCLEGQKAKVNSTGSTLIFLGVQPGCAFIANLGDSPAFLFHDDKLNCITKAHTDEELLHSQGIYNRKPGLVQFLGVPPEEFQIDPYIQRLTIRNGDLVLLCSDGLTDMLPRGQIQQILTQEKSQKLTALVSRLISGALVAGGRDNTTVLIGRFEERIH